MEPGIASGYMHLAACAAHSRCDLKLSAMDYGREAEFTKLYKIRFLRMADKS